ncbi:hypothetical protein [Serratia marcescens]|uniref:hypothetical protein n=1 Tax=Serratia marcescens TaxID=615 RepID=UPI002469B84F|nr:hypothetical protein [Serratia marcescens]WGL77914.1 hypothetical protein QFB82_01565 [Serratia marcescens]
MTLTTEQLRAEMIEKIAVASGLRARDGRNVVAEAIYAEVVEPLLTANREAQPVAVTDEMALAFHRALNDGGIGESDLEEIKVGLRGALCSITVLPAPALPERLPCPVHLLPGLKFGKGVPTRSMLDALVRRAEYESEREAMTPEQKAEDDARIEALKALLPQPPAPAVPEAISAANAPEVFEIAAEVERLGLRGTYGAYAAGWNACRAAMLAQPVSSGCKFVPDEPTDEQLRLMLAVQWPALYREHLRHPLNDPKSREENERQIAIAKQQYAAMLAAAPEGGNEN